MPRVTACSTLTFALSSLQTALEHIAGYGFDRVEIADMLTHTKHFSTHSSRTVDPVAVRDLLERNGLTAIAANCALVTIYQDGLGFEKLAAPRQSAAEREDVRKAKENVVFYKLHEPRQAEAYKAQALAHLCLLYTSPSPRD